MPPPSHPRIALEELRELQRAAAEHGHGFDIEVTDETGRKYAYRAPATEVVKHPLAPEGVHFTSHQRVGDEIRDSYINHIHEMFAGGYIDSDEHDARLAAMMLTHTKEEMEFLIQDLPRVTEKKVEPAEPAPEQKQRITIDPPAATMLVFTSLLGAVVTGSAGDIATSVASIIFTVIAVAITVFAVTHKK